MAEVDEVTDSGAQEAYDEQDEAFAAQDGEDDAQNGEQEVDGDAAEGDDDAAQDAQDDRSGSPPPSESASLTCTRFKIPIVDIAYNLAGVTAVVASARGDDTEHQCAHDSLRCVSIDTNTLTQRKQ
eukprot:3961-Heterococcus_DN1.PRE.6